jgi:GNAT superfamily N-acetyltransferase
VTASPEVIIRKYEDGDRNACHELWAELTHHHRRLYGDPTIGGLDPGAGFDGYMADPLRLGTWVADRHGVVVGLTGLLHRGSSGEVEPVVVTQNLRASGVGRMLIERVIEEAVHRGYEYLAIRPVVRNVEAIQAFHASGFHTLGGHVDLTMDLAERRHGWLSGETLHGLPFDY